MPRHPADSLLRPYVAGESWPPEEEDKLRAIEDRVIARTETPTGSHDLRELLALTKQRENAAVKDELARIKKERADELEHRRKFWDDIKKGLIIGVGTVAALGLAGAVWKLVLLLQH